VVSVVKDFFFLPERGCTAKREFLQDFTMNVKEIMLIKNMILQHMFGIEFFVNTMGAL
jgi:hypothetical protein